MELPDHNAKAFSPTTTQGFLNIYLGMYLTHKQVYDYLYLFEILSYDRSILTKNFPP